MKMGFSEIDITPQNSVTMIGFNRKDNHSKGILDRLVAQVSLWENKGFCCLVTIDNLGFHKNQANTLRDMIAEILDESREKVMLCFSHTHAAVNTKVEQKYFEMVCQKVCDAAKNAKACLTGVSVGWGNAFVDIGENRRENSKAVDKRAGILKVCDVDSGELKLLILRLTAHCNVLKRDNYLISADYFGAVRNAFEKKYHCPVMIIQGSAGNIAPKYYHSTIIPIDGKGDRFINSETAFEDIAQAVIKGSEWVLPEIKLQKNVKSFCYSKNLILQSKVPDIEEARKTVDEAFKFCGIDGKLWLKEVEDLRNKDICFQEEQLEIQYFEIGNWCLCGIPNETMTEFAIEVQELLGNPYFYFNGYTNGCSSYFPTKEEYDLGGYEVYWAMLLYFREYGRVYPYYREAFDIVKKSAVENYIRI